MRDRSDCNGTGIDDADWTGRCWWCRGTGWVVDSDDERDEEEEAAE